MHQNLFVENCQKYQSQELAFPVSNHNRFGELLSMDYRANVCV